MSVWSLAPLVASQADALAETMPRSARQLEQYLEGYDWGGGVLKETPGLSALIPKRASILSRATGVLSSTLGILLATPLVAVALVLVKMLHVEDLLGDQATLPVAEESD